MTPEKIVRSNLESYNQRNIESFMSSIAQDIEIINFGDCDPSVEGYEAVKAFYKTLFEGSPDLHSTIINRIVIGNKVIDHENIVGRDGMSESLQLVLVYEIRQSKIFKITVVRDMDPATQANL